MLMALSACPNAVGPTPRAPTPENPDDDDDEDPDPPAACPDVAPARVPILPRTSNNELHQFVQDLVGAPVDPALFARWTPLAQVRGFDTMTESRIDAQTLEEQLRTTEEIAALLVNTPEVMAVCPEPTVLEPLCALHATYDATAQFSGEQGLDCWSYLDGEETPLTWNAVDGRWVSADPGLFAWNTGMHPGINTDVIRRWVAPQDGTVIVTGTVTDADPGGGDGVGIEVRAPVGTVVSAVIVNGGAPESFEVPLAVQRGDAIDVVIERGASNAYDSTGVTTTVQFTAGPAQDGLTWASCGALVVERIAGRAYRRPLRAEEKTDLQEVFDETLASATTSGVATPFREALEATLQAALLSPNVLYKPEFVPGGFDASEESFRRAARLALYFRSSFPDDELWMAASVGALDPALASDDVLRAHAERMLAADADRFVQNFAGQWLNFRALLGATETPLATSMRREGHDVFATILTEHGPPASLIAPGFTVVDGPLAAHYGLAGPGPADGPTRVETAERGGLFAQGHFLSGATGSDFKRVIHRGLYALNRTLCSSVPMLDPATLEEIAMSVGEIDPTLPLGERMQMHRETSERCTACHAFMDPLGLALEHYDDTGRWRDVYPDGSVISNGYDFNGVSLEDPDELASFVAGSDDFRRCVAEKLLTFGLHRAPRGPELCRMDELASGGPSLHDLSIDAFLLSLHMTEER